MKPQILAALILGGASLAGCVQNYAEREIVQGAAAANVVVTNAPAQAHVWVGGRDMGTVQQLAKGLSLPQGRHDIVVKLGGQDIHKQAVFVSAGARVEVRVP